jgi:hypothetical protein
MLSTRTIIVGSFFLFFAVYHGIFTTRSLVSVGSHDSEILAPHCDKFRRHLCNVRQHVGCRMRYCSAKETRQEASENRKTQRENPSLTHDTANSVHIRIFGPVGQWWGARNRLLRGLRWNRWRRESNA